MRFATPYRDLELRPETSLRKPSPNVPAPRKINYLHLSTLIAVSVLVGTEVVGASWAAGWALGGLLQLAPIVSHVLEGLFALSGFVLLFYFMRVAVKHESIYE